MITDGLLSSVDYRRRFKGSEKSCAKTLNQFINTLSKKYGNPTSDSTHTIGSKPVLVDCNDFMKNKHIRAVDWSSDNDIMLLFTSLPDLNVVELLLIYTPSIPEELNNNL
ncbi:MAG: hypothetical protein KZQ95_13735 [Candidatus Thiodiazotropha sp. (ex Epidulcina cf. delphinae)]|nr:hypothetical protein [Candidatus Thiodiazotropha sp. (ex Epidulcina cf. delphinae)]